MILSRVFFLFMITALISENLWAQEVQPPLQNSDIQDLNDRDPFRRPKYIEELEKEELVSNTKITDESIEAIRRWPLKTYKPIAVIWDVADPKVMVLDMNKTMHLLKKNYRIGNQNGIITEINEGEIIVNEKGVPNVLKIDKGAARR